MEWFKEQGHTIPEPSDVGMRYASFLEELSEKEPPAFTNHFYNFYFGHAAGGVLIGKKVRPATSLRNQDCKFQFFGTMHGSL